MASFKPRGVAGGGRLDLPQYSYLSPARLGLGLSLAIDIRGDKNCVNYDITCVPPDIPSSHIMWLPISSIDLLRVYYPCRV